MLASMTFGLPNKEIEILIVLQNYIDTVTVFVTLYNKSLNTIYKVNRQTCLRNGYNNSMQSACCTDHEIINSHN